MGAKLQEIHTNEDIEKLAQLAHDIWFEYWPERIGEAQTSYMVEKFQSLDAIKRDMAKNAYEYWFVRDESNEIVGYTGGHVEEETNRFFISKIYLLKTSRGHGYASDVIRFYEELCQSRKLRAMYLTVNKYNDNAIRAYDAKGFKTIDACESDIGEGFIMDDFIMEKEVTLA